MIIKMALYRICKKKITWYNLININMYTINDFKYGWIESQGIGGIHLQKMDFFYLSVSLALWCTLYANLYKYVPLLVLVSYRQLLSLTISNVLTLLGNDILQSTTWWTRHPAKLDLEGAIINQQDDLSAVSSSPLITFLHALPNCSYLKSSFGVPHRLRREPSATNLY